MRQIPNIISSIRLLMIVVFIYFFINNMYLWCLVTYLTAFFSDILDGYLARRNNWITDLGKILDPLADKLMLVTALICFYIVGWLPLWIPVIVAGKELLMILGGFLMLRKKVVVFADWFGKIAAGLFAAGVVLTLVENVWTPLLCLKLDIIVFVAALISAVAALIHYAKVYGMIGDWGKRGEG